MKRRWIVYSVVNILQLSAVMAGWAALHDPAHARAAAGWRLPLAGTAVVDRPFQPPASQWGAGHRGVDLRGDAGQDVLAAGDGTVAYSGLLAGRGVVVVKHADGLRTTYEPVADGPAVGTSVEAGEAIGQLASGHSSCRVGTTCLHWGLLRGDTYLDPLRLVLGGRVRLLPVPAADQPGTGRGEQSRHDAVRLETRSSADPLASARSAEPVSVKRSFYNTALNLTVLAALGYGLARAGSRVARWARGRRRPA